MDIQTLAHDLGKSVSTLKRWKKQIEHLAEYEFEEKTVQIGRNQIQKIPDFDSKEVRRFQKMAQLIDSKGLEQAIIQVWGNARVLSLENIQNKHNHLAQAFVNYRLQANKQMDYLKKENQSLKTELDTLTHEFKAYQENNKKKKGLFK
ncbi:hypothetical protein [Lactococcus lactis]|uniref:hypothetical protein n=1 Tax=Lactococcus lactis TaxID=1358 RepID=UPI0022E3FC82|nr:hypothetical protein [Lactococcus lactis]